MSFVPEQLLQKTAFDQLSVESETAEVQISARYDTFRKADTLVIGTGTAVVSGGEYQAACGVGTDSASVIFSERQIISRPGQGSIARFDARFTQGIADTLQFVGPANAGDAAHFGFSGVDFGVFYNHGGGVQVYELTFTVAATGAETADVVIDGTTFPISIDSTTINETANDVAVELQAAVPNYNFTQNGAVVSVRSVVGFAATGAFTYTATGGGTAVGAFVQLAAGAAAISDFTAEADWNGDAFPSLNPLNTNFYTIRFNGDLEYSIQDPELGPILVHSQKNPNSKTTPLFGIEAFRLSYVAQSLAATAGVTTFGTNAAAFIEGSTIPAQPSESASNTKAAVGTTVTNILTLRCREVYGTRVNLGRLMPVEVSASTDGNKGAILQIFKNATLGGTTDFSFINKTDSIAEIDTSGTTVTAGSPIISVIVTAAGRDLNLQALNELILPGDTLTLAMSVPSGGAADMNVGIIWEEDL